MFYTFPTPHKPETQKEEKGMTCFWFRTEIAADCSIFLLYISLIKYSAGMYLLRTLGKWFLYFLCMKLNPSWKVAAASLDVVNNENNLEVSMCHTIAISGNKRHSSDCDASLVYAH
jgi:hypothetical protein